MGEEINSGVAYLLALKQSTGSGPGIAAGAATLRPQGRENRRSPRYGCEGSAEVREEGRAVRTWATFTDISMGGCYVRATTTYPVGAALHLKLEVNGHRMRIKGTVRAINPGQGAGIAFADLSDGERTRLRELLQTLSQSAVIMGPRSDSVLAAGVALPPPQSISDPAAAIHALLAFFEGRQMLMREEFLRLLRKSQPEASKP